MLHIKSEITHGNGSNVVNLSTNGNKHQIQIPNKEKGLGLGVNGGEMLFLAISSCFVNDLYREAPKFNIQIVDVHVEVTGEFQQTPGSIAENIRVNVTVKAYSNKENIKKLIIHTNSVAEIPNTLRMGISVNLGLINCISL